MYIYDEHQSPGSVDPEAPMLYNRVMNTKKQSLSQKITQRIFGKKKDRNKGKHNHRSVQPYGQSNNSKYMPPPPATTRLRGTSNAPYRGSKGGKRRDSVNIYAGSKSLQTIDRNGIMIKRQRSRSIDDRFTAMMLTEPIPISQKSNVIWHSDLECD